MVKIKNQTQIQLSKEGVDKIDVVTYLEVEVPPRKPGPLTGPLKYVEVAFGFLYRWIRRWLSG